MTRQMAFMQAMMAKPVLTEQAANALWQRCAHEDQNDLPFADGLNAVRVRLDALGFAIQRGQDHRTGQVYYVLVNTIADDFAQLATDYTPAELALYRAVVDLIMESDGKQFAVPSLRVQQEGRQLKASDGQSVVPLSNIQIQDAMDKFVRDRWLDLSRNGKYMLSVRSLLELEAYLEERFAEHQDILDHCERCRKLVTVGRRCETEGCQATLHHHCARMMARSVSAQQAATSSNSSRKNGDALIQCPRCHQNWDVDAMPPPNLPVGRGHETNQDAGSSRRRSSTAGEGKKRPRSGKGKARVEEEDEDDVPAAKQEPMEFE